MVLRRLTLSASLLRSDKNETKILKIKLKEKKLYRESCACALSISIFMALLAFGFLSGSASKF